MGAELRGCPRAGASEAGELRWVGEGSLGGWGRGIHRVYYTRMTLDNTFTRNLPLLWLEAVPLFLPPSFVSNE